MAVQLQQRISPLCQTCVTCTTNHACVLTHNRYCNMHQQQLDVDHETDCQISQCRHATTLAGNNGAMVECTCRLCPTTHPLGNRIALLSIAHA
jgi:hypothetical protein